MSGFGRKDEYNAGHSMGRTFDDGQGAKLLRPENRVPFVDIGKTNKGALEEIRDALIHAGIMQGGEDAVSTVDPETINEPIEESEDEKES